MPRTPRNDLERLRSQAATLNRRASQKVSRLAKTGVFIQADPSLDPRRSNAAIGRMTAKQLTSLNDRLSTFTARSTKFVPGSGGAPIPLPVASQFRHAQDMFNLGRDQRAARFGRRSAAMGRTFEESRRFRSQPSDVNGPLGRDTLDISGVTSARAARTAIRDYERRGSPAAVSGEARAARDHLVTKANDSGNTTLINIINTLTPEEAAILDSSPEFMTTFNRATRSPEDPLNMDDDSVSVSTVADRIAMLRGA